MHQRLQPHAPEATALRTTRRLQHGEEADEDGAEAGDHAAPNHCDAEAGADDDHREGGQHE